MKIVKYPNRKYYLPKQPGNPDAKYINLADVRSYAKQGPIVVVETSNVAGTSIYVDITKKTLAAILLRDEKQRLLSSPQEELYNRVVFS